jgi:hypothetical protein
MRKRKRKQDSPSLSGSGADPDRPLAESDISHAQLHLAETPHLEGESLGGQRIVGSLDAIVGHTVEGWAMNVQDPTKPVTVEIFDGEQLLGSAVALMFRPDLLTAGIGTGNHHFKFLLPESAFDGKVHIISARPAGSPENLRNSPAHVAQRTANVAIKPPTKTKSEEVAVGMLDVVSDDGWVKGWAWYPDMPDRRVDIEVLVDGEVIGETVAALHRPDLVSAGIGDGNHSFVSALPHDVLARPKASLVSVRDKATSRVLAEPRLFQRREIANAIEKLSELENDARLLNSTVALAADRAAADERAAADLFRTVGDFFVQLANATAAGKPAGSLKTLRGAIEDVTSRFPPIEFSISSDPKLSICVEATGSLETIYNTLRSISGFQSAVATEVVLFDTGACDEASLLPVVVRNLRYIHVGDGGSPASARNLVAEFAQGQIMVFLAGFAVPAADWLEAVFSAFDTDPSLAVIGAKVLRDDGVLANAGVMLTNNRSQLVGEGADPSSDEFAHRKHIDAVTGEAFAVRRDAWQRNCGVSESHVALETALVDLCVRITAAGGGILYEPKFDVILQR